MKCHHCCPNPIHCILPPHVIDQLVKSGDLKVRQIGISAMEAAASIRSQRLVLATLPSMSAIPSPTKRKHRLIYHMHNRPHFYLPGELALQEGGDISGITDEAILEAYNYSGEVYDFYYDLFSRNSLDNKGMSLISSVHVGSGFNNAFWNGEQMAYGDGDGSLFIRFTKSIDVVGHELSHGVITHTCNLEYYGESGALNEHFADVMGSLVRQRKANQSVQEASWTVGAEIMGPGTTAKCLRTFKNEAAYKDDPILGTDPQPKHKKNIYTGSDDNGGVHINSGIPNHAFYLTALKIGGNAWEKTGKIWYDTMLSLSQFSKFNDMVALSESAAIKNFGSGTLEHKAVKDAWKAVGF